MSIKSEIEARLRAAFVVTALDVVDDSASHAGHAGAPAGGESHFNVMLRSPDFSGQSRLQRHRAVHNALGDLVPRIHALALDLG